MFKLKAKWFVLVTALISTGTSLAGGLVMYYESLRVVEDVIEQQGEVDMREMSLRCKEPFDVAMAVSLRIRAQTEYMATILPPEPLRKYIRKAILNEIQTNEVMDGLSVSSFYSPDNSSWFLESINYMDQVPGWYMRVATYPGEFPDCEYPCQLDYVYSPEHDAGQVFNYHPYHRGSQEPIEVMEQRNRKAVEHDEFRWMGPLIITLPSGVETYYFLATNMTSLYGNTYNAISANAAMTHVEKVMLNVTTKAVFYLTHVNNGSDSLVMASNAKGEVNTTKCAPKEAGPLRAECGTIVADVSRSKEILYLMNSGAPDISLVTHNKYWMFRNTIVTQMATHYVQDGQMTDLHLMWFLSRSVIEDEMTRALLMFVGFLLGVVFFDAVVGVAEVVMIAKPLGLLARFTGPLQLMDLDSAEMMLAEGSAGVAEVEEVTVLRAGLLFAVKSLREYKSFLPNSLFAELEDIIQSDDAPSSKVSDEQAHVPPDAVSGRRSEQSAMNAAVVCGMTQTKATILSLVIADVTPTSNDNIHSRFSAILEQLVPLFAANSGVLHPFYVLAANTLTVTWPGTSSGSDQALRTGLAVKADPGRFGEAAMAASYGHCRSGNTGTSQYRGAAFTGPVVAKMVVLRGVSELLASEARAPVFVVDKHMVGQVQGRFVTPMCGVVVEDSKDGKAFKVAEVVSECAEASIEWMYESNNLRVVSSFDKLIDVIAWPGGIRSDKVNDLMSEVDPTSLSPVARLFHAKMQAGKLFLRCQKTVDFA